MRLKLLLAIVAVLAASPVLAADADNARLEALVEQAGGHPLPLYYTKNTIVTANDDGTVGSILLKLDKGETIPTGARLYLMVDTYPVYTGALID